jgi:hypothetical protein
MVGGLILGEAIFGALAFVFALEVRHSLRTGRSWLKYSFVDRATRPRVFVVSGALNVAFAAACLFGCIRLLLDFLRP